MKTLTISIFLFFWLCPCFAQSGRLRGKLVDNTNSPIPFAGITLSQQADTTRRFTALSDSSGNFNLSNIPLGSYVLQTKAMGYRDFKKADIIIKEITELGILPMQQLESNLNEVSVVFVRPQVEQKVDRTILNVSGSISSSGASVYDVLERAPGVSTDGGKSLNLRGRAGVSVMVDGKVQPISGEDLMAYLKGMPAGSVEKIELITSPSAKYDAAGNAGIIDIRTKKEKQKGFNGTLNANFIQGRFGRQNGGLTLNRFINKWNLQAGYNFQHNQDFNQVNSSRQFLSPGLVQDTYVQDNFFKTRANVHIGQLGADYSPSKQNQVGLVARFYKNDNQRLLDNLGERYSPSGMLVEKLQSVGSSDYGRFNPNLTATLRQTFKKSGYLNADADYASYRTENIQKSISTPVYTSNGGSAIPKGLLGDLSGKLKIYSAKLDYGLKLSGFIDNLETGVKLSKVNSRNTILFSDPLSASQAIDPATNNDFIYNEDIFAAYLAVEKKLGKFSYQLGLRYEQTSTLADQLSGTGQSNRNYGQLFPSLSADYKLSDIHALGISVNRRIDRPTFRQLNPFRYYLNENTYSVGNPDILPQSTTNIELSHTIAEKFTVRYILSDIKNNMFTVLEADNTQVGTVRMIDRNLRQTLYYGLEVSAPISIGKWYKGFYNINIFHNRYLGELAGTDLAASATSFTASGSNTFTISPTWSAELTLNYRGKNTDALQITSPIYYAMAAAQKLFLEKKLSLKITLADMFYTNKMGLSTTSTLYNEEFMQRVDSRLLTIGLSYRFGNAGTGKSKKAPADEIKQRAN